MGSGENVTENIAQMDTVLVLHFIRCATHFFGADTGTFEVPEHDSLVSYIDVSQCCLRCTIRILHYLYCQTLDTGGRARTFFPVTKRTHLFCKKHDPAWTSLSIDEFRRQFRLTKPKDYLEKAFCIEQNCNENNTLVSSYFNARNSLPKFYDFVAVGGTFDRLHEGHKLLLTTAALITTGNLRVGVTSGPLLLGKKHFEKIQQWPIRASQVQRFLKDLRCDLEVNVIELVDPFGGTDRNKELEAIVVTPETTKTANMINEQRICFGLFPLDVITVPMVKRLKNADNSTHSFISSTLLRESEASQLGNMKS